MIGWATLAGRAAEGCRPWESPTSRGLSEAIELVPRRDLDFSLADGTIVHRRVSECYIVLPQGEGHTPVILGEPGDAEPLLGAVTLEILRLVFNPFNRTLQPMRLLLI